MEQEHISVVLPWLGLAGAIVGAAITAIVTSINNWVSRNKSELDAIHQEILQINKISIDYPYLEDDFFCAGWDYDKVRDKDATLREQYQRYDNYCCIVFNTIERLWQFCEGNQEKIERQFAVKEMAARHAKWWKRPSGASENIEGYDREFRQFVEKYTKSVGV